MQLNFLTPYLITTIAAAVIAFVATPLTLVVARRMGFIDSPAPNKLHLAPIPLLGGVAIWAALVGGLLLFGEGREIGELVAIIVGGTLISVIGLVDDRYGLGPRGKLIGQTMAAAVLVLGGVQTHLFGAAWANAATTILWVVVIVNAINLTDNMDGLAAGVAAVAAGSFLLLAVLNGQILVSSLAAALLGACLGFLFYNFQPAVTFMGDTGSMLLGFALAVLGIKLSFPGTPIAQTWMVPLVVLGLPLFDMALVVVSRWRRGVAWWKGGTDHVSHRLARLGLSHRRVVVALYVITLSLGLVAVVMVMAPSPRVAWMGASILALTGLLLLYVMEQLLTFQTAEQLRADMRIVFIAGGAGALPALEAAATLASRVTFLMTKVAAREDGLRELTTSRFREALAALAKQPGALKILLRESLFADSTRAVGELAALANSTLQLRGQVLCCDPAAVPAEIIQAIADAQLILIAGDLNENALPTLLVPEIRRALYRSRQPRVLIHEDPSGALRELKDYKVDDVLTHAVAPAGVRGPWSSVPNLRDRAQLADVLYAIRKSRIRSRSALQPLSVALHG